MVCAYFQSPAFGSPNNFVRAQRLDSAGDPVWLPAVRDVCSVLSAKDDPEILAAPDVAPRGPNDGTILAWTDGRNGQNDVFAQRINIDGSLGPPAAPPPCVGDANGDGMIDFGDITAVLVNFGQSGPPFRPGDANGDGVVDFGDITAVLVNFGNACA